MSLSAGEQSLPGIRAAARLLRVRWIVRAPIWLFRARLGFLFSSRLLMLEHTGRKSGVLRYAVLEIVGHPRPGTYIVASGFGTRAQWFRNVQSNPRVRVWVSGRRAVPGLARLLTGEESASVLAVYADRYPRTWAALKPVVEETFGDRIERGRETSLPLIALDLDLAGGSSGT